MEWILVLTLHMNNGSRDLRDLSTAVVPRFTSEATCKEAAQKVAESLIRITGKSKERLGVNLNASPIPAVNFECLQIRL